MPMRDALTHTVAMVFCMLSAATRSNSDEMPLITEQVLLRKRVEIKPEFDIRAL